MVNVGASFENNASFFSALTTVVLLKCTLHQNIFQAIYSLYRLRLHIQMKAW